jgi:hypothetical protein
MQTYCSARRPPSVQWNPRVSSTSRSGIPQFPILPLRSPQMIWKGELLKSFNSAPETSCKGKSAVAPRRPGEHDLKIRCGCLDSKLIQSCHELCVSFATYRAPGPASQVHQASISRRISCLPHGEAMAVQLHSQLTIVVISDWCEAYPMGSIVVIKHFLGPSAHLWRSFVLA